MRCHYCSAAADVTAESGGLTVGLCDQHLRERLEELAESGPAADLEELLDADPE